MIEWIESLEELGLLDEETVKPLSDVSLQSDHRCWSLVCRSMEITTVTAGVAGCKL